MLQHIFTRFALTALSLIIGFPSISQAATAPTFRRPIDTSPYISAYYDNQSGSGIKTYACGSTTYNGHTGTDFAAPRYTSVYAAAYGGMYYTFDNCPSTGYYGSTCGGGYGNHARVDHEGDHGDGQGWLTIYAHLTKGTLVRPQFVDCGEFIGQTGSSGSSTGPHLHFEVKKYNTPYNDPFAGQCGGPQTFWSEINNSYPTTKCTS